MKLDERKKVGFEKSPVVTKVVYPLEDHIELNWGSRPDFGQGEPKPITPEMWAESFANWFVDYWVNTFDVPARKARADGKPRLDLEQRREELSDLYAYPDPERVNWTSQTVKELWPLFLEEPPLSWRDAWSKSGRTLEDLARALTPEGKARLSCRECSRTWLVECEDLEVLMPGKDGQQHAAHILTGEFTCPQCRKSE